jgi:hypothetical protein
MPRNLLRVILWFVCLSHIALGAAIMLSPSLQERAAQLYGAQVEWTPQFSYILRPLGAFMVALGAIGIAAAVDPWRYRVLVWGFAGLLGLRVLQRLALRSDIEQTFGIPAARNLTNAAFFLALAVVLVLLMLLIRREQVRTPG